MFYMTVMSEVGSNDFAVRFHAATPGLIIVIGGTR